jgi:type IV secretory pathway VirB10-like protein
MNEREVLRGYRAANEALDEAPRAETRAAVLAAAARVVEAKPRAVDRMRHWRFPLAAAATVLISTIAVLVATRTEQEAAKIAAAPPETSAQASADIYAPEPPAAAPAAPPPAPAQPAPSAETPQAAPPAPQAARRAAPPAEKLEAPAVAAAPAAPPAAADAVASSEARAERSAADSESAGLRAARERARAAAPAELAPAQWIERIVALREAGRDDEADRELKRFRERYPDFKLPPAALRKAAAEGK